MSDEKKRGRPLGKSRCECQCVGYLPAEEMKRQLLALVADKRIGHFWFVEHEPDEDCSKPHIHLRMTPPPSRAVDWASIAERVSCVVEGETLPRKLVLGKGAVNDASCDGLLYARHDSRYCRAKNLVKATYDYPRESFVTDCVEWLDGVWLASDEYDPPPVRMTVQDVTSMVEACNGEISDRSLLRVALVNGLTQGVYNMLAMYARELRNEQVRINQP